jgi:hypothetical protein
MTGKTPTQAEFKAMEKILIGDASKGLTIKPKAGA